MVHDDRPFAMQYGIGDVVIDDEGICHGIFRARGLRRVMDGGARRRGSERHYRKNCHQDSPHRLLPRHVIDLAVHVIRCTNDFRVALVGALRQHHLHEFRHDINIRILQIALL